MGRLQRIGKAHSLLAYQTDSPDHVDFAEYLRRICKTMTESLGPAGRVKIEVDVQFDSVWRSNLVVPLGLMVGEALTDALKHAFPEGRGGRIEVELRSTGDGRMRLSVADDGVGLPEQPRADTLGLRLIEVLAKQIGGHVSFDARAEGGTALLVTFPDPNARMETRIVVRLPVGGAHPGRLKESAREGEARNAAKRARDEGRVAGGGQGGSSAASRHSLVRPSCADKATPKAALTAEARVR